MKTQAMEYPARWLQRKNRWICVPAAMLLLALSAHAQDQIVAPIGGPGGSPFVARCPAGQILGGLEVRTGDDIDAIRPLCIKPTITLEKVRIEPGNPAYNPNSYDQYQEVSNYGYSDPIATTDWYGGPGGSVRRIGAQNGGKITGIYVEVEGVHTLTVNGIALVSYYTTVSESVVDANELTQIKQLMGQVPSSFRAPTNYDAEHIAGSSMCPLGTDGFTMTAVGIHGRTGGLFVDAIGLICGYPGIPQRPVHLGRVQGSTPATPPARIDGEPMSCAYARSARARNSPAAPSLEQQCEAARRALPPVALGRVHSTTPSPPITPLNGELPICARARDARARNSPAAPNLQRQCDEALANAASHSVRRAPSNAAAIVGSRAGIFTQPSAPPLTPAAPPPAQAPPADAPINPPPPEDPLVPAGPAMQGQLFSPPLFDDGSQLWACADAVQGRVKGSTCDGIKAGKAYCSAQGYSGALQKRSDGKPAVTVARARAGIPVSAVNGDACTGNACVAISELQCAP